MCLRFLLNHILSLIAYTFRENWDFVFIIIVQFMMSSNSRMHFGLQIVFLYLYITSSHYHHCADFSKDIELIKCLSDIFCRLCAWDEAYSLGYPLYNIWGCGFSVYPYLLWWLRDYVSYYHHQIGSINYYPLFRVRSWNNGVRCMSLYIFINKAQITDGVTACSVTAHDWGVQWPKSSGKRFLPNWLASEILLAPNVHTLYLRIY